MGLSERTEKITISRHGRDLIGPAIRRRMALLRTRLAGAQAPLGALRERYPVVWLAPLLALLIVYGVANFALPQVRFQAGVNFYLVQPAVWLVPGVIAALLMRPADLLKLPLNKALILTGLFIGLVQIAAQVIVGVLAAFGRSPYSHALLPVLGNTLRFLAILASVELTRSMLAGELNKRSKPLALILPSVVFALALLPFSQLDTLAEGLRPAMQFGGEMLLPALAESLLATFLALLGGPVASFAYLGLLGLFHWLSPVLPNPGWIMMAFVGTLLPLAGLLGVYDLSLPETMREEKADSEGSHVQWLIVAVVALILIWFNNGAFGYHPTLLSGPSMRSTLWAGDVVIVKTVDPATVQIGDIIKFEHNGRHVVHRVREIEEDGSRLIFITQGDNVNAPDPPVMQEQVVGRVVLVFPKVGYVSIWLRDLMGMIRGGVVPAG